MPDPAAEPVLRTLALSSEAVPRSVLAKWAGRGCLPMLLA
jgi:hypothetical protein